MPTPAITMPTIDMADTDLSQFQCDQCGRRFRWSKAAAGRRVRCPCGAAVTCPAEEPGDAMYELAGDAAPQPPRPAAVEPVPTAAPAAQTPAPAVLAYRNAKTESSAGKAEPETIKNLYMPLWLLAGGVVIEVVAALLRQGRLERALIEVAIEIIFGTAIMLAGILLAAKFRGIDLGRFWTAVFKLSAISVAPSALGALASPLLNVIPFGGLIGWIGEFVLYFALLGALFDLDESDTWYCVFVIFLVRLGVYFLMLWGLGRFG
jgi:hypothetical protein